MDPHDSLSGTSSQKSKTFLESNESVHQLQTSAHRAATQHFDGSLLCIFVGGDAVEEFPLRKLSSCCFRPFPIQLLSNPRRTKQDDQNFDRNRGRNPKPAAKKRTDQRRENLLTFDYQIALIYSCASWLRDDHFCVLLWQN